MGYRLLNILLLLSFRAPLLAVSLFLVIGSVCVAEPFCPPAPPPLKKGPKPLLKPTPKPNPASSKAGSGIPAHPVANYPRIVIDPKDMAAYEKLQADLEYYSNFRDVTAEANALIKLAPKVQVPPSIARAIADRYESLSRANIKAERDRCGGPTVDLRRKLGPVRNQAYEGWCFGFSAADLLSAKLGKTISAADTAIVFHSSSSGTSRLQRLFCDMGMQEGEGGFVDEAISKLQEEGGACLENRIPSEDNAYGTLHQRLMAIDNFAAQKNAEADKAAMESSEAGAEAAAFAAIFMGKRMYNVDSSRSPKEFCSLVKLKGLYPQLSLKKFIDIMENTTRADVLRALDDANCGERIPLDALQVVTRYPQSLVFKGPLGNFTPLSASISDRERLYGDIDAQLTRGNVVEISYGSGLLYNLKNNRDDSGHASLLVGKRYNQANGQCEYLLRNSWGRSCGQYDPVIRPNCQDGTVWVPKSALMRGTGSVTYIK